jgi:hypothetical protein
MSRVERWKLSNVSANISVAIFRVNTCEYIGLFSYNINSLPLSVKGIEINLNIYLNWNCPTEHQFPPAVSVGPAWSNLLLSKSVSSLCYWKKVEGVGVLVEKWRRFQCLGQHFDISVADTTFVCGTYADSHAGSVCKIRLLYMQSIAYSFIYISQAIIVFSYWCVQY